MHAIGHISSMAMRTLLDRFLARFGYWRWPVSWRAGGDPVARGQRWQNFYGEEGGLQDMIRELRRGYFEKAGHLQPGDIQGLQALSLADRILAEIDGRVRTIIVEGEAAARERAHADKIAALPEAMRRRL